MIKKNLTEASVEKLPFAKPGQRYNVFDTTVNSLMVRISNQNKIYYVYKKIDGKPTKVKIGEITEITLKDARDEASKCFKDMREGKNVNLEKKKRRNEITFQLLLNKYIEEYSKLNKTRWKEDEADIPRFYESFLNKRLSSIKKDQIEYLFKKKGITDKHPYAANKMLDRIKSMYNQAIQRGWWEGINPALGIKKFKEVKRDRFLQASEFPLFFKALEEEPNKEAKNYIWMSLFTGARKANVLAMRWDEIDYHRKIWRIPKTKNGDSQDVVLTDEVIKFLKEIKNKSEWVFPSPTSASGHLEDPKKAWDRILTESGLKDLRLHDLRRTLASMQAILGTSLLIIAKSMGHKSLRSTEIYARLNDDPVRHSMEVAVNKMLEYSKPAKKEVENEE